MRTAPYKVVQWATGNVGTRSLRSVIEHPNMELVGLYAHSKDKAGRDAGELAGLSANGIEATNSIDEIVAFRADCVPYMQQGANIDDLCRLLAQDIAEAWDLRESGWHIVVEGDVPLDVSIRYPIPWEQYAAMTPGLTAHRAVNAVPVVCEAAPGIRTTAELPQVISQLG